MATNFPGSLDSAGTTLPYPTSNNDRNSPSLASISGNEHDALIAIETKLGIGSSSQTPSAGYLLRSTANGQSTWDLAYPASGTFLGTSDTQIITNKTINASNNTITNLSGSNIANLSITATQIANATITATQIANATITATQIANGGINYANLLSTIFSGQVSTYTNSGTAGGTGYYVNLGGIKILWGTSASVNFTATGTSYTVIPPTGFFTTVQIAIGQNSDYNYTGIGMGASNKSNTSITFIGYSPATTATTFDYIVIGT